MKDPKDMTEEELDNCICDEPRDESLEYEHGVNGVRVACACGRSGPWMGSMSSALVEWNCDRRGFTPPPGGAK